MTEFLRGRAHRRIEVRRMRAVGYRSEVKCNPLKGDLKSFWSISISGNWPIVFRFDDGDVYVDLVDYH